MDFATPCLTGSPASPSTSYCSSSETSSLDYPSPPLDGPFLKLSSLYIPSLPYCLALQSPMDPGSPVSPRDDTSHLDWAAPAALPQPVSASSVPGLIRPEYGPFGGYGATLSQPVDPGVYRTPAGPLVRQYDARLGAVSLEHVSRPFRPPSSLGMAAHVAEGHMTSSPALPLQMRSFAEYDPVVRGSNYPPSTSLGGPAASTTPYASYPDSTQGYLSDSLTSWNEPPYGPTSSGTHESAARAPSGETDRRPHNRGDRPHKSSRRLTTREDAHFQCPIQGCGKMFNRSYNFKAHMETHDEKREYPFLCPVEGCDKKFVRKTDLQRHHQSVHKKERNHRCDYCGRLFARKDTLRRHMDDGCSRRFDIGTLELPRESPGTAQQTAAARHRGHSMGVLSPLPVGLPAFSASHGNGPTATGFGSTHTAPSLADDASRSVSWSRSED